MEEKYQFLSEENGDKINEDQTESFQATNERKESMRDDMDQLMRAVKESNESVEKSSFLQGIHESLNSVKEALLSPSKTSRLWIQHTEDVEILKLHVRAERTGE